MRGVEVVAVGGLQARNSRIPAVLIDEVGQLGAGLWAGQVL